MKEAVLDQTIAIKRATRENIDAIAHIVASNRDDQGLFQKSASSIADVLAEFLVARLSDGTIVGCAALHRDQADLAEMYSVAVLPQAQGRGVGRALIEACLDRARRDGIRTLWLATMRTEFFARHGFVSGSKWSLSLRVLRRKLRMVFEQPASRWLGTLFGRHTFMWRHL